MVFEVFGANPSNWILCHAASPDEAIDKFEKSFPGEIFHELKRFVPQEARTACGDRVTVLRSRKIGDVVCHETEPHTWTPASDLTFETGAIAA